MSRILLVVDDMPALMTKQGEIFSSGRNGVSPRPPAFFLHSQRSPSSASVPRSATFSSPKSSPLLASSEPSGIGLRAPSLHVQCRRVISSPNVEFKPVALDVLFQELGLNERETESLLTRDPDLRLKSIRSLRARVASLKSVGISGLELCHLVVKCPSVLAAGEIDPFILFVRDQLDGKVDPMQLKRLFMSTEPRFLAGFEEKVNLLIDSGIPREKIVHVLDNVNLTKALSLKPFEEIERLLNFLSCYGGVDLIVRHPPILNFDMDTQLIPRVEFLLELSGGDEDATGAVLRKLPTFLKYRVEHLESHVEFLRSFAGLDDQEIFRIILVFPSIVSASKERKLRPRISFLKECGLNSNEIFKFLTKAPLFLGLSFEGNIAYKLGFLVKIGYKYRTKEFAAAIGSVTRTSCENMQKVIELFLSYGFSCEDMLLMSRKHPQILQYNPDSLEEKVEYLVGEMGRDLDELLDFPAFLGYKLDSRIKHRYEVKKKIIGEGMSINKLLNVSSERFAKKKVEKLVHKA
ncbi:transcription termination factor MTERF8, chloroplastic isoform X2 [Eucalyptus grandis]|uniref:transcription termination factor MTERF8, chloroplastic isoform X2 n=1 Tax=Eucalyptus grandis TaxID=71139 RepID=UPI00192E934A|nr:transcription termination factor MTERF8, chloroplastic isoform X2 [Eucalyptus grandis]